MISIGHSPPWRTINKRKGFYIVQLQRLHAQYHRSQRRAQHFRIGQRRSLLEIRFVVKTYTHARPDAAATPCPLMRSEERSVGNEGVSPRRSRGAPDH